MSLQLTKYAPKVEQKTKEMRCTAITAVPDYNFEIWIDTIAENVEFIMFSAFCCSFAVYKHE